jgi:dGTP triphosphohydrolase
MPTTESYEAHVADIESRYATLARRSFDSESQKFVDGGEIYAHFSKEWEDDTKRVRLVRRTPLQIERDRIIYAPINRKLAEKYQVLYNGPRKVIRNYTTHVARLVQASQAICHRLKLNQDFAEAIALGAKCGAPPFVHASKVPLSDWVQATILKIDNDFAKNDPGADKAVFKQIELEVESTSLPGWMRMLRSKEILQRVVNTLPWAAGIGSESAYSSGQQAYWMIATRPYSLESRPNSFTPETLFGVWRHSMGQTYGKDTFSHRIKLESATAGVHQIGWQHATIESHVVSEADDFSWVIENINDANSVRELNGFNSRSIYDELTNEIGQSAPQAVLRGLTSADAGSLYNYFISDFHLNTEATMAAEAKHGNCRDARIAVLSAGVGLSAEAKEILAKMKNFLAEEVFRELRVANRTRMLQTLSRACLELIYTGVDGKDILESHIHDKATIEKWTKQQRQQAQKKLNDPIHRIQATVNMFSELGDHEVYSIVGIDSL